MDLEKNIRKEPVGRLVLSILAFGLAILVGFVAGIRSGDRNRNQPRTEESPLEQPLEQPAEVPETDLEIDDEPALPAPSYTKQQIAQGVEYLASHNHWNRSEMEKIVVLRGLWDAVNTYKIDEIRAYNELLASTPLTQIVEGLERTPKAGYYAAKGDQVITLSTYIKRMR